jgi:S1-C subfamily serine protease
MIRKSAWLLALAVAVSTISVCAQTSSVQVPTSVDSGLVMDAAGPEQRKSIGAIYLVVCPETGAGTGFLLDSGVIATNAHVVGTRGEQNLVGITASNQRIHFRRVITDHVRDLALLIPDSNLSWQRRVIPSRERPCLPGGIHSCITGLL